MFGEEGLLERVNAGDPRAEEEFFSRYWPRVRRAAAYFLGGDGLDADDVAQDTMIVALKKLDTFDCRAPVFAWLKQICLRLALSEKRRRWRTQALVEGELERLLQAKAQQTLRDKAAERRDDYERNRLEQLKRRLGPENRRILELRSVQGMSYTQIARTLGVPMGTVSSRLKRAKDRMKGMERRRNVRPAAFFLEGLQVSL